MAFGYDNNAEFLAYYETQRTLALAIEDEYNFSELSHAMQIQIIDPILIGSPFFPGGLDPEPPVDIEFCDADCCSDRHDNCDLVALGDALAGYALCFATSFEIYPLCAVLVLQEQFEDMAECDEDYNHCMHNRDR